MFKRIKNRLPHSAYDVYRDREIIWGKEQLAEGLTAEEAARYVAEMNNSIHESRGNTRPVNEIGEVYQSGKDTQVDFYTQGGLLGIVRTTWYLKPTRRSTFREKPLGI